MARRSKSKPNIITIIGGVIIFAVSAFAAKHLIFAKNTSSIKGAKLSIEEFLENANSLRGNEYVLNGKIDQKLPNISDAVQVVAVKIEGKEDLIAVRIPSHFNNKLNIERDMNYSMKIKILQGGIPEVTDIQRL